MVKPNNNRLVIMLLALIVVGVAFTYGIVVGKYKVFPYAQLRAAKAILVGKPGDEEASPIPDSRQVDFINRIEINEVYEATTDIVMIGDSITDYAEWSELFPDVSVSNRGIAGDTTDRVLGRIDSIIATGATSAFIMIGVNDLLENQSVDAVISNYAKIIDQLIAGGMQPYIQSTILVGEKRSGQNSKIMEVNSNLRRLAAENDIVFIDLNSRLAPNGVLDSRYTVDAIHLNAAGYRIWKDLLRPIMDQHSHASLTIEKSKMEEQKLPQ